jgi:hypothetical protein
MVMLCVPGLERSRVSQGALNTYPSVKAFRSVLLKVLRVTKINNLGVPGNDCF